MTRHTTLGVAAMSIAVELRDVAAGTKSDAVRIRWIVEVAPGGTSIPDCSGAWPPVRNRTFAAAIRARVDGRALLDERSTAAR
jgi:hypothetical protein